MSSLLYEMIAGKAGRIEACIQALSPLKIGILCHPHPLYGGTMDNKVVVTTARAFHDLNMTSIRFNFRGAGKSEGSYADGIGETEDVLTVIDFAQKKYPDSEIYLAGFSFGAYTAIRAASCTALKHLILIAPAVNHMDFSGLSPQSKTPWAIVIAEKDSVAPSEKIHAYINYYHLQHSKRACLKPTVLSFPDASHFFDGRLIALKNRLTAYLQDYSVDQSA